MTTPLDLFPLDHLWNQAFTRMAGAPARVGNRVDLLQDAAENYPAWLEAIAGARAWVHFESYIIHDDAAGRQFADALEGKARSGVTVRVLYDWWGARGLRPNRLWRSLRAAGVS
jgi:cardiolipin synthase